LPKNGIHRPQGHTYDKTITVSRSQEIAKYFEAYARPEAPEVGKAMSPELKKFMAKNGNEIGRLMDPLSPKTFDRQVQRLLKSKVESPEQLEALKKEVETQLQGSGGALARVRDGLAVAQILKREGLSLDYESIGPALWTALDLAEKAMGDSKISNYLRESKTRFVKLYVQQTGNLPPEQILAESRKYLDPKSVFIPEEIFSLAKQYKVAPERVPYLIAGLKADEIRKMGQEAFRSLTYEDLRKLADSPEGQAFLKEPKNAMLLQDTLKSRAAFQGLPLLSSMLMVFPT